MSLCMGCLWLNPNLIFQLCSASILTQPLCQEMISRWGLIWRWTLILGMWIKWEDRRVAVESVNVQQCHGRTGDATSSLQYRAKTEKLAGMVLQLLEMRVCRKKQHEHKNKFYYFCHCKPIFNADYSRKYLSVASENRRHLTMSRVRPLSLWPAEHRGI